MNTEKLTSPVAIIIAGIIIAGAIIVSGGGTDVAIKNTKKGVASQIPGISEVKLQACIKAETYKDKIIKQQESGDKAMGHLPNEQRGTPYNVLVDSSGVKVEAAGALPYEVFKQKIDSMLAGKSKSQDFLNIDPVTGDDHIYGNKDAKIKIVEYADLECPFCAQANPTFKKLVDESNGQVAWVLRQFPLSIHANSQVKAEASECVWAQGGDTAFFSYVQKLFDIVLPQKPAFDTTTL